MPVCGEELCLHTCEHSVDSIMSNKHKDRIRWWPRLLDFRCSVFADLEKSCLKRSKRALKRRKTFTDS